LSCKLSPAVEITRFWFSAPERDISKLSMTGQSFLSSFTEQEAMDKRRPVMTAKTIGYTFITQTSQHLVLHLALLVKDIDLRCLHFITETLDAFAVGVFLALEPAYDIDLYAFCNLRKIREIAVFPCVDIVPGSLYHRLSTAVFINIACRNAEVTHITVLKGLKSDRADNSTNFNSIQLFHKKIKLRLLLLRTARFVTEAGTNKRKEFDELKAQKENDIKISITYENHV